MTTEEKDKIKEKILTEIETTKSSITSLEESSKPVAPDDAIGRLTRMEAINAKSISEASLCSSRVKLAKLEHALSRIEDPDFGVCRICAEPIPIRRIMFIPETTVCVRCADR